MVSVDKGWKLSRSCSCCPLFSFYCLICQRWCFVSMRVFFLYWLSSRNGFFFLSAGSVTEPHSSCYPNPTRMGKRLAGRLFCVIWQTESVAGHVQNLDPCSAPIVIFDCGAIMIKCGGYDSVGTLFRTW